jgi:type VI secretion system secreted protein Hcp
MASDIFLKLADIKGEAMDDKHKDEIEVLSFSWGVTNPSSMGTGSGGGLGKANFQDLHFNHHFDKASPVLLQRCADGKHLKEGVLTQRKSGGGQQEFLVYKLSDIIVTSVADGGNGDGTVSESVSLAFGKVELEYKPQKPDGTLEGGVKFNYDINAQKGA